MDVVKYIVSPDPNDWGHGPVYDRYSDARESALIDNACVIELTFEFSDSELIDDFRVRPDGPETARGGLIGQEPY